MRLPFPSSLLAPLIACSCCVDAACAREVTIDIPSQPLTGAISALGRQAKVEIMLNAPGLETRRTRAVRGRLSVSQALVRLCRGMNVTVKQITPDLYLVTTGPPPRPATKAPAMADEPQAIMVTARRRPEREEDVPLSVSNFSEAALQRASVHTLSDLARLTPGFVATEQASSATPLLVSRGQRRALGDENRLPSVVYQDEVPLPNQAALSPLYDIASIEILRGPQGTLFGRNATSGAVLIRTAQPGNGTPAYLETDIGNRGLTRLEGAVELPASGPLSLRLSGQRLRRDGYTRLASGGRADGAHSDALRTTIRFAPDGLFRSTLSFDMLNANETGAALILVGAYDTGGARTTENAPWYDCGTGACDIDSYYKAQQNLGRRTSQAGLAPIFERRFRSLTSLIEYGDDTLLVRNIMGWRSTHLFSTLDGDGTPLRINDSVTRSNLRQWSEELQVQGRWGAARYIGGIFYLNNAPAGAMGQEMARFVRPDNPAYYISNYQTFRSAAVFGQVTLPLGHDMSADLGLRYTAERISGCSLSSTEVQPLSRQACLDNGGSAARASSRRLTWTAALSKKLGAHNLYLTSRRAFRSGGYNSPRLGGSLTPFQTFKPETLTDLELGLKGRWQTPGLVGSYTVAAYAGLYTNIQRPLFPEQDFDGDNDPATDPINLYINSGRARITGIDGELALIIGSATHINAGASWIDARYTGTMAPPLLAPLLGDDPLHNRFSYTPRFSATVSITHKITLRDGPGSIDLNADYSHVSSTRFTERTNDPFGTQPAHGLLGASITWHRIGGRPLDVQIWGRNLTDRFYASGGGTLNPAFTAATIIPGPPRTFGLRIRYSFE
ncbi:MAG: TonB-dependent receptor [Sphingobium sp.]